MVIGETIGWKAHATELPNTPSPGWRCSAVHMTRWLRTNEQQQGCNAAALSLGKDRLGPMPASCAVISQDATAHACFNSGKDPDEDCKRQSS